jgi:hypothetical protein
VPLPDLLADLADRIVGFYDRGTAPPFLVYQYEPSDEYAVRRELFDLKRWLKAKHEIGCQTISLAEVFWDALKEHGQLDMVEHGEEREAVFLYRVGSLYPAHRTSPLLDVLKDKINRPVVMLYPGRVVGDYGLSFMGKSEPAYGYRALIIPRGGRH